MDKSGFLPEEEYYRCKQAIYNKIKHAFDSSFSPEDFKQKVKPIRKSYRNERLKTYFSKIFQRFLNYARLRELDRGKKHIYHDQIKSDIKGLFREASNFHKKGSAFEQGNIKFSTKIIYIAKKS